MSLYNKQKYKTLIPQLFSKKRLKGKVAFTLVELIVVITIIAILSTIGFVSYSGFSSKVRDSSRLAQLKSINGALESYTTRGKLPLPDDRVTIYASGTIIGYQGNAGEAVLNKIGIKEGGKDPNDDKYYTYAIDSKLKNIQLLAFLENDPNEDKETSFRHTEHKFAGSIIQGYTIKQRIKDSEINSEGQNLKTIKLSVIPTTYATDYTNRIPRPYGSKLGILLDISNNPIQENLTLRTTGFDVVTQSGTYIALISKDFKITGSGSSLVFLKDGAGKSCSEILAKDLSKSGKNGTYYINISGTGTSIQVYCDMTTDGGGWTLVGVSTGTTDGTQILTNNSIGNFYDINTISTVKMSTNDINKIAFSGERKLRINNSDGNRWIIEYSNNGQTLDFVNFKSYNISLTDPQNKVSQFYDTHQHFINFSGISSDSFISNLCPSGCRQTFAVFNSITGKLGVVGDYGWPPFIRRSGGNGGLGSQYIKYNLFVR